MAWKLETAAVIAWCVLGAALAAAFATSVLLGVPSLNHLAWTVVAICIAFFILAGASITSHLVRHFRGQRPAHRACPS